MAFPFVNVMIPRDLDSRYKTPCEICYGLAIPTDGRSLCGHHDLW
jgi:hypothetical protein